MRIAVWSGPRNLSTAMMYAFAARSDCAVVDEPFYAAYLAHSGVEHPMQKEVLASQSNNPQEVVKQCLGPIPNGKACYYQKHMTMHMLPGFPIHWLDQVTNVFMIRHPAHVIASYQQKREQPTLADIGFQQQAELFEHVAERTGRRPVVFDSGDLLERPEPGLKVLCEAIGLPFEHAMLNWPAGGNEADGVWAAHWYQNVWKSAGLAATEPRPLPKLEGKLADVRDDAMPYYEALAGHRLDFA